MVLRTICATALNRICPQPLNWITDQSGFHKDHIFVLLNIHLTDIG